MKKRAVRRRKVEPNRALRCELIAKGLITPPHLVPASLKERGFEEAAKAADERLRRGNLYGQRR